MYDGSPSPRDNSADSRGPGGQGHGPGPTQPYAPHAGPPGPQGFGDRLRALGNAIRERPAARRALSVLSVLLLLAGAGMFAYPFATDVYSRYMLQGPLEDEFNTPEFRQEYASGQIGDGKPVTRIIIPSIGVDTMVVEGIGMPALRAGAGHYPNTPLPGEEGNVAIAGHRTTYGKPFNRLDEVPTGAKIRLQTPLATHTYRVTRAAPGDGAEACPNGACWITHPRDWGVVSATEAPSVTLTTCHPKGSAAQRLILRAELVKSKPREGVAASPGGTTSAFTDLAAALGG